MKTLTPGLLGFLVCLVLALAAGGLFLGITLAGDYNWVARLGGSAWVAMLSLIVLLPLVIPWMKRRQGG